MRNSKAHMLGLIYLIFMTTAAIVYGFDRPDVRFSPDGRYLAVATSLGVEIRDADTREQLRFLPGASRPVVFNHQTTLLVTGPGTIWDTADFTRIAELPEEQSVFAFTPDDRLLITGHWETAVSIWDTENWQKVRTYSSKYWGASIHGLSISPDGKLLCASFSYPIPPGVPGGPFNKGTIIIWEIESGREIKILVDGVIYPAAIAFSPDGAILATQIRSDIVLWETQTWGRAGGFGGGSNCYGCPYSMEFQPGTRFLAYPYGRSVRIRDTDVVAEVRELSGHAAIISSISFHPNGKLLAIVSLDGDMKLWDVASGEEIEMNADGPDGAVDVKVEDTALVTWGAVKRTALLQNYPNPFNPDTWIPYALAEQTEVSIKIYNVKGQLIGTLNLGKKPAGLYVSKDKAAYWDGRNEADEQVSSGVYFYTIQAGDFTATKKMVVAK